MSRSTISTWYNLLFPEAQLIFLFRLCERTDLIAAESSTFAPPELKADKLPSGHMHLVQDLPFKMSHHLCRILEENYPTQAEATVSMQSGISWTPLMVFDYLGWDCSNKVLNVERVAQVGHLALAIYHPLQLTYYALTENKVVHDLQVPANHSIVITDHSYAFSPDETIKILWENKSPNALDLFVGQLTHDIVNCGSRLEFSPTHTESTLHSQRSATNVQGGGSVKS